MYRCWSTILLLTLVAGCGRSGVELAQVRGTVKFADGTVPQGEVSQVFFEPAAGGSQRLAKGASGTIGKDGSYELMTVKPGDGVIPGKYKVFFKVHKTYLGQESLIPEKYTQPDKTPFEVTVESGNRKPFDFTLDKQ